MNARDLIALPAHLRAIADRLRASANVILRHQGFIRPGDAWRADDLASQVEHLESDIETQIKKIDAKAETYRNNGPPIQMLLICPRCSMPHVDKDEWAIRPHRTHRCEQCQHEWRPAMIATVGVESLTEVGGT